MMTSSDTKPAPTWVGYCAENAIYMETFLVDNKIPVLYIASRMPLAYFPELSEQQLNLLKKAGWKLRNPNDD